MTSPGTLLRLERERQKKSLQELAAETRIASKYLDALEHDEPGRLPGDFFYRTWAKQYAMALGIDSTEFDIGIQEVGPRREFDVLQALCENYQPVRNGKHRPVMSAKAAALLLIGAGFAGSAAFGVWRNAQEEPWVAAAATAPNAGSDEMTSTAPASVPPQSAPAAREGSDPPHANPAETRTAIEGSLELVAREKTWVSVSADGRTLFAGVLNANEVRRFALASGGRLLTGNAAGVSGSLERPECR